MMTVNYEVNDYKKIRKFVASQSNAKLPYNRYMCRTLETQFCMSFSIL